MSIENTLERIATALETIAAKGGTGVFTKEAVEAAATATTPPAKPTTTRAKPAAKATDEQVQQAAAQIEEALKEEVTPPVEDEKIVHAGEEAPPAEPDPLDAPTAEEQPEYTAEDVRKALKEYRDIEGSGAMMEVLKNHGAENMSGLKPDQYASVMKAVK